MLEEYNYRLRRRHALTALFTDVRVGVGVAAACLVAALQSVELVLLLSGHS